MAGTSSESSGAGRAEAVVFVAVAALETGLATWLILVERSVPAGVCAGIAGLAIGLGMVRLRPRAPATQKTLAAAAFALTVVDRFFDGLVLSAVAWIERSAAPQVSVAALAALGSGFLCAYTSSRARSVGFDPDSSESVGLWVRAAALAFVTLSLLVASIAGPALWAAAAVQLALAIMRSVRVARASRT